MSKTKQMQDTKSSVNSLKDLASLMPPDFQEGFDQFLDEKVQEEVEAFLGKKYTDKKAFWKAFRDLSLEQQTEFYRLTAFRRREVKPEFVSVTIENGALKGTSVTVPILNQHKKTVMINGKEVIETQYPAYCDLIRYGKLKSACESLAKELMYEIRRVMSLRFRAFTAPIFVSAEIPAGHYQIMRDLQGNPARIVVNESEMEDRAIDGDGDVGSLVFSKQNPGKALFIKFPLTKKAPILHKWNGELREKFHSLHTEEEGMIALQHIPIQEPTAPPSIEKIRDLWYKAHKPAPIGILTSEWNAYELAETRKTSNMEEKISIMFRDPCRFEDIEKGGLKQSRQDGIEEIPFNIYQKEFPKLNDIGKMILTSTTKIAQIEEEAIPILTMRYDDLLKDISELRIDTLYAPEEDKKKRKSNLRVETKFTLVDDGLIRRLEQIGKIGFVIHPHDLQPLPENLTDEWMDNPENLYSLELFLLHKGQKVALIDQKRGEYDLPDRTVGFCYMIPPCYSHGLRKIVNPLEMLKRYFSVYEKIETRYKENGEIYDQKISFVSPSGVVCEVKNPATQEVVAFWPRVGGKAQEKDEKNAIHLENVREEITTFASKYGFLLNTNSKLDKNPSRIGREICSKTVTVKYPTEDLDKNWEIFKGILESGVNLCASTKSKDPFVKKYAIANEFGGAIWADPKSHAGRPAKNSSQLSRALVGKMFRVAIVNTRTQTGVYFTPSGVDKQRTSDAFYPRCFNTLEEAQKWADEIGTTDEPIRTEVLNWAGGTKIIYLSPPKHTVELGKFIDAKYGMKFMPGYHYEQVIDEQGREIDCLLPLTEVLAKGAQNALLSNPKIENILIDGREVEAIIVDMKLFRSGSGSENVPGRFNTVKVAGCDQFALIESLQELSLLNKNASNRPTMDLTFINALQQCFEDLVQARREMK